MSALPRWSLAEAEANVASIDLSREIGQPVGKPVIVLDIDPDDDVGRWRHAVDRLATLPVVTVARSGDIADAAHHDVDALAEAVLAHSHAAATATLLLRHLPREPLAAFHAESAAYATLQAGPEHQAWLADQGRRVRTDDAPRVRIDTDSDTDDTVTITLTRPRLHNLLDRQGRDELADAFRTVALFGDDVAIRWRADGPSFCAGGDPAEFGSVADPPSAHLIRAAASPAPALAAIRDRVQVDVHGACVGAGVELAAQGVRVSATADARFRLPELTMGLIPGVGGTWSIGRRIGRRRLLTWLLLDLELDAPTALEWGLIDQIAS